MKLKPCRDCGELVAPDARGCPKCARNLEAERMLARYFWGGLSIIVLAIVFAIYFVHSNR
jgi:RNA polymerase subunit RPABC4/transcription elongation factor Spt4